MFLAASTATKQQGGKIRASFLNFLIITISLASRNCGFQNTANHLPFQNIAPYTVMNVNYTYCGDHFAIYTSIKSLHCIPETKLYVNYTSIKKKKRRKTLSHIFLVYPPSLKTQIVSLAIELLLNEITLSSP